MKFTDGYWHLRPGNTAYYPANVHDVKTEADALTVYGPTKRLAHRGDTLDLPLITVRFSSPMPNVIRVQIYHHQGKRLSQPEFQLYPQPSSTVEINDDAQAATTAAQPPEEIRIFIF